MSRRRALLAMLALSGWLVLHFVVAGDALAGERRDVSFLHEGRKIVGTLMVPDGVVRPPVVLLLHGMGGQRSGSPVRGGGALFERTASVFSDAGLATLAISTGGRGGSEGSFLGMTLQRRIGEARAALDFIVSSGQFDTGRIGLLGHSQGGPVAMALAADPPASLRIPAVVLWAPQLNAAAGYRTAMGANTFREALSLPSGAIVSWKGIGGRERRVRAAFVQGLAEIDTSADISRYAGRLRIVTGSRDPWSRTATARAVAQASGRAVSLQEFHVGHRMGGEIGPEAADQVARDARDWFLGMR